ncbi:MAG: cyclase family protein [Chloroflexi bacterium]|nr:cyclase family protein [Chloroflexota bacterium]MQC26716.1 cyclase family protein [Chloroflexota bacterium]
MKIHDLSQDLNQDCSFWPYYPPFEVKYFKRKSEHGVNAQYIQTSNHMGTHMDAPRHFVTNGKTIEQLPLDWLYGEGVIVDISDKLDELAVFTPEMLDEAADIKNGDILFINTGWHKYTFLEPEGDEEKYILRHPGPHHSICEWLLDKKIHLWGVDMISTDHPMNLPIGRFLGKGGLEQWAKVRAQVEKKFGGSAKVDEMFPPEAYQLTHNALFPHDCFHVENLGGEIGNPELQNKRITLGAFPWKFKGGEAAFCRAVAFTE